MATSVITHIDKGKGIALLDAPTPPTYTAPRPQNKGVTIQEPNAATTTTTTGTKRPFTRKNAQVGNFVRSILKPHSQQHGQYTLQVDAALNLNHLNTRLGAFIRNSQNYHIAGFSIHKWGASTPLYVEAQALLEGLHWCSTIKIPFESIESNSLQLVPRVNNHWKDNSALSSVVQLIRQSLSLFPNASMRHISRVFNSAAHKNARESLRHYDRIRILFRGLSFPPPLYNCSVSLCPSSLQLLQKNKK
ncbi:hypothetical protein F8388_000095 [Cannabis sativa]|uniref:RNase H type-1 domain-containing protein n=1 Tax=Cannabis sativa TaxID=3483 RepID=A0A7J6FMQ5_CANSA|nr:hypothetical protein F8388_000095 [Cannabis sativa]